MSSLIDSKDTIFALSTIQGKSGVAVVRISGEHALYILQSLSKKQNFVPRYATYTSIFCPHTEEILDNCIAIYFQAPHSFTGEDTVELHLHGSIAVINGVLGALNSFDGVRAAYAGEFSSRAFLNDKIGLTEAEGLSLLIDAQTEMQRTIALRQMSGNLEDKYEKWRQEFIKITAYMENLIDFPEDDIPKDAIPNIAAQVGALRADIEEHLNSAKKGIAISEGIKVAIVGPPNAGKSSLLNAIAKEDIAITSDIAGTTRDILQVRLNIKGYYVIFYDTAGLREANECTIEAEGIRRAKDMIKNADIIIYLFDISAIEPSVIENREGYFLIALNKIDMCPQYSCSLESVKAQFPEAEVIALSIKNNLNMESFYNSLDKMITEHFSFADDTLITKTRHEKLLREAISNLDEIDFDSKFLEIIAEYLRYATESLGKITGKIDIEEVLDKLFGEFCIGK